MRSIEDKGCLNYGPAQEVSGTNNNAINFEFHKGNGSHRASHHRTALGKPTPSKWDDAQKWLVNLSRGGERHESKSTKPRNSNADDRRLIGAVPVKEEYYYGEEEGHHVVENGFPCHYEVETKNVDSEESIWRINTPAQVQNCSPAVRSICVRDMGTEMTPIGSQDPSRSGTPIIAISPAGRSPISSGHSTPVRGQQRDNGSNRDLEEPDPGRGAESRNLEQPEKVSHLETRAVAWNEAERAKYMARYKRDELKIQAWENHEKRKAEMEMKRTEVKAERLKARAQENMTNKLAATRRIAEEKLANAEAKLNEKAVRTSERADYIRRTGHLPSSFSFKLPSFCW